MLLHSVVKTYIFVVEILFLWDWCCHLLHDIYNFHWNSMLSSGFFSSINHTRLWWLQNNVTLAALFFCCVNWPVFCQTLKVCWMHFCCRKKIHLFRKKTDGCILFTKSFQTGKQPRDFLVFTTWIFWAECCKTFLSPSLILSQNKLDCLSLASFLWLSVGKVSQPSEQRAVRRST